VEERARRQPEAEAGEQPHLPAGHSALSMGTQDERGREGDEQSVHHEARVQQPSQRGIDEVAPEHDVRARNAQVTDEVVGIAVGGVVPGGRRDRLGTEEEAGGDEQGDPRGDVATPVADEADRGRRLKLMSLRHYLS
jgi:hypothetical protein